MLRSVLALLLLYVSTTSTAQLNMSVSDPVVDAVLHGDYDPILYTVPDLAGGHEEIICALSSSVDPDSLKSYLIELASFSNRNTYSDTISDSFGIGAARRWALDKFSQFSADIDGRLLPAYFDFDLEGGGLCGDTWIGEGPFRNVLAVLPGTDTVAPELVIIEAHIDSRCEDVCDIDCLAEGIEDNASGTALVIELARVMSRFTYEETIVFMLTTGEEQGLYGAGAFADYCQQENIAIRQVQNNDIVGGIICGETSSPPSCTEPGSIDSLNIRIFANPSPLQAHRSFARYVDYIYDEKLAHAMPVPMNIAVQNQEDRTGRGGDHIPFRENGYTAIRFTSANEHGDGAPDATYTDRQHTHNDIMGVDTDADGVIDSFFVSFTYLQRNTMINATMAALGAYAPSVPEWELLDNEEGLTVQINDYDASLQYRVAVRTGGSDDWEYVYRADTSYFLVPGLDGGELYFISIAAVNESGVTGLFSREFWTVNNTNTPPAPTDDLAFTFDCASVGIPPSQVRVDTWGIQCIPNPWQESCAIVLEIPDGVQTGNATFWITDRNGRMVDEWSSRIQAGANRLTYSGQLPEGIYTLSVLDDGAVRASVQMVIQR